jgi:hypothetical protein
MTALALQLDEVDWDAVAAALRAPDGIPAHVRADAASLSALFATDFHEGTRRVAMASELEPLNPLHEVRRILLLLRFGESGRALELARSLQEQLPPLALPAYLRALAMHREGEYKRASNAAAEVVTAFPAFAPARFLQAEAQLRTQFKGLRKVLSGLPRGEAHKAAWLELMAQLLLSGGEEARGLAAEIAADRASLPPGSHPKKVADRLLELSTAGVEELEQRLDSAPAGSRAEEGIVLLYNDRLDDGRSPAAAISALGRLMSRFPGRAAIRRVYVLRLTRVAVDLAAQDRYAEALRVVERCLQLEPHEVVHYQNRAALFTLMREPSAYHDAWYELERHQFRLALIGRLSSDDAAMLARPHRLFAQQARLPAEGSAVGARRDLGFLMETTREQEKTREKQRILAVNDDRIDEDPDLLRQWIHHRRAELTFAHWGLGPDPMRFLLYPDDVPAGRARFEAMAESARSLGTLVPDEGKLLAGRLIATWGRHLSRLEPAYARPPDDPEADAMKLLHLETFADLALLCLTWKPDSHRTGLVEEVLAFLKDEGPFFDDAFLQAALQGRTGEASYPLKLLAGFTNDALGLDPSRTSVLDERQRAAILGRLAAELLTRLAYRTYEQLRGNEIGARRALEFIERARRHDPENVRVELSAARFLLIAGHDDESRATLAKLQRSARAREPEIHSEIEELRRILDERASTGAARRQPAREAPDLPAAAAAPAGTRVAELEAEIDQFPAAIQAYEELARKLAAEGLIPEAIEWSERAITQCLGRDGQLRARSLNIEMLGLRSLGSIDRAAVGLYARGAHRPALEVLEKRVQGGTADYTLEFLRGHCHLAIGQPEDARLAFERALEHCGRQLHRTVLRGLAMDVDQPFLGAARRAIADKLGDGAIEPALREARSMMARLRHPEAALVDLAQIHLDAATVGIGTTHDALPAPTGPELALCGGRLAEIYRDGSDLERSRRLAQLAISAHEPSRRKAELILRKAEALEQQAALAEVLARSGNLLREGNFAEALAALDAADEAGRAEPRLVRQRALLLLKLERFAEAEAAAETLRRSTSPVAREFLASFPALAFRQRIAAASRMLRAGDSAGALTLLENADAGDAGQAVELAYCRGFGLTMDAHRLRRAGDQAGARRAFADAMDRVEPHVAAARASGHSRLIDLYEALDKELDNDS